MTTRKPAKSLTWTTPRGRTATEAPTSNVRELGRMAADLVWSAVDKREATRVGMAVEKLGHGESVELHGYTFTIHHL